MAVDVISADALQQTMSSLDSELEKENLTTDDKCEIQGLIGTAFKQLKALQDSKEPLEPKSVAQISDNEARLVKLINEGKFVISIPKPTSFDSLADIQLALLADSKLSKSEIKNIYKFLSEGDNFKEFLNVRGEEHRNAQFDLLTKVISEDLNDHTSLKEKIFAFAFTTERMNYICIEDKDFPKEYHASLLELEKSIKSKDILKKIDTFEKMSRPSYEAWEKECMSGSGTIASGPDKASAWKKAREKIIEKLRSGGKAGTSLQIAHRSLVEADKDAKPGIFRSQKDIVRIGGAGSAGLPPCGVDINELYESYSRWLDDELIKCKSGEKSAILLAAQAGQKLVSLHPFHNGNGRLSRMASDFVLLSCGLPPAVHGTEELDASFGLEAKSHEKCRKMLQKTRDGVVKSHRKISVK